MLFLLLVVVYIMITSRCIFYLMHHNAFLWLLFDQMIGTLPYTYLKSHGEVLLLRFAFNSFIKLITLNLRRTHYMSNTCTQKQRTTTATILIAQ